MPTTRRSFIARSAALMTAPVAIPSLRMPAAPGYSLKIMATSWGFKGDIRQFCRKAEDAGYDGIEVWVPNEESARTELRRAVDEHRLLLGLLTGGNDKDPAKHLSQFRDAVANASAMSPFYINCHSGRDFFDFERNRAFMDLTMDASARSGIPIHHETHRSRALYTAPITRSFIEALPRLSLTFDVSHWCNVHESLLADQSDTIDLVLPRVELVHARIGHPEGPQVNDPRAPEWEKAVNAHLAWWDRIVERKRREGKPMPMLTEFGPADYLPALPYTRQPVADQWDINLYMMNMLRKRYQ